MAQDTQKPGSFSHLQARKLLLTIVIFFIMMIVVSSIILFQKDVSENTIKTVLVIVLAAGTVLASIAFIMVRKMVYQPERTDETKEIMKLQVCETDKLASFEELATGIAHEINNPVAIMIEEAGWIEDLLAEEDFKDGENLKEFKRALVQIRTQGRRCKEITQKLLSFACKTDARVQELQLNEIIRELLTLSEHRAKFSNIIFETHLQKDLPTVRASLGEIQQVLLNLINNALDAMEKSGGILKISSSVEPDSILKGDHVSIAISDNGSGIPSGDLDRIFDPFFTTKPVGKGTGLGLSICYGIIKKMGGNIEVRSVVDEGTTFKVKIPIPKAKKDV
jgi:two-component system, NtrC family, sensor kinase